MAGNQLSDEQRNGIRAAIMNSTCTCNGLDVPWRGMTADQVKALTDNELRVYGKWLDSLTQAAERAAVANSSGKGNSTGNCRRRWELWQRWEWRLSASCSASCSCAAEVDD
jgi:hypothetical protein